MDKATKITLVIAVLLLVILITVTILNNLKKMNAKTPYPECPDYWNKVNKVNSLGPGSPYCLDTRKCNGKKRGGCRDMHTFFLLNNNRFNSDYEKCRWAKNNDISWEGIDKLCTKDPNDANTDYTYTGERDIMRGEDAQGRKREYRTTIYDKATPPSSDE